MNYSISEQDAIQVVKLQNLISEFDNKIILKDIEALIEKGNKNFVVDLSSQEYMNSVGLNFMIMLLKKSKHSGGQLAIANASDEVVKLFELTKLKTQFNLEASVDDALQLFK